MVQGTDNKFMANHSTQQILKAAQDHYLKGDFENSLKIIRENKDSLDPGLFHYNLGSIYLKLNDFGPARYHLEKAKDDGFSYPMLWNNLEYIKLQPGVSDPVMSSNWKEYSIANAMDVPMSFFYIYILAGLSLFLLLLKKKWIQNRLLIAAYLSLLIVPVVFRYSYQEGHTFAVAMKDIRVHEGPSKIYPDYGKITAGSRVVVGRFYDNWYYIVSPSERSGWVDKVDLGFY